MFLAIDGGALYMNYRIRQYVKIYKNTYYNDIRHRAFEKILEYIYIKGV